MNARVDNSPDPSFSIGFGPVFLFNAARRFEIADPAGLPVIWSAVGPAWDNENVDVGCFHALLIGFLNDAGILA